VSDEPSTYDPMTYPTAAAIPAGWVGRIEFIPDAETKAQERLRAGCQAWGPGSGYVHISELDLATLTAERDRTVGASVRAAALAARLAQAERVVEVMIGLVALKDGPRNEFYYRTRDTAWQDARDALAAMRAVPRKRAAVDALDGTAGPGEEGSDGR